MSEEKLVNISVEHINELEKQVKTIDSKSMAQEVLNWVVNNVENFIDNTSKHFKLDLILDNNDLPETRKAQDLYRECGNIADFIMEDILLLSKSQKKLEKLSECRKLLDKITEDAHVEMKNSKEQLEILFKKMSFFYERIIPNPESKKRALEIDEELKKLVKEKEGAEGDERERIQKEIVKKIDEGMTLVKFTELEGAVSINKFDYENFDVGVKMKDKKTGEVTKEYNIPESFVVWLEIVHKPKVNRPTSMF